MSTPETPYADTEALLAILNADPASDTYTTRAREILAGSTVTELRHLLRAAGALHSLCWNLLRDHQEQARAEQADA